MSSRNVQLAATGPASVTDGPLHLLNQSQKFQQDLEEMQKENQQTKDKLQEVQSQVVQNQRSRSWVVI